MNGARSDDGSAILWREPAENEDKGRVEHAKFSPLKGRYPIFNRRYVIGALFVLASSALLGFVLYRHDSAVAMHKATADSAAMTAPPTSVVASWVPTPGPGATTAPTTVTTQPAPPAPPAPPALPDTTGTNLDQVTRALFQLKYSLDQHPDMSMLSQIYSPGSSAYNHFAQDMQTLVNNHTTGSQPPATISTVDVVSMTATTAVVRAHTQYSNSAPLLETLHLVRGTDGHWRITDYVVTNQ